MYFHNRAEAGRKLAKELMQYVNENTTVVALSPGGLLVGAQISIKLHASLLMLLTEKINIPGEPDPLAALTSAGTFTYNNFYSPGQLEDFVTEYHNMIEEQRIEKFHKLNRLVGVHGELNKNLIKRHNVILASDGINSGFSIDIASDFLKPISVKKIIMAVPIANVTAVDKMHLFADEIHCLSVLENYISTNHYYDDNTFPNERQAGKILQAHSLMWDVN